MKHVTTILFPSFIAVDIVCRHKNVHTNVMQTYHLMVGRCVWLFIQDEDVTQVEYKEFHADEESFYPSFTFCFTNPILYPEHFGQFGEEYTEKEQELIANWSTLRQEYHNYLNGKKTEENRKLFANVDYDKMTQSLENYMEVEAGLGPKRDEPGRGAEYKTYTRVRWAFRNKTQILGAAYRQKKNETISQFYIFMWSIIKIWAMSVSKHPKASTRSNEKSASTNIS